MAEKGWFQVPGIRPDGDRTAEEQLMGLDLALAEAKGKTVLDLGCAEGVIALEFAKAGARSVFGIELLESHLVVARQVCAGYPVRFQCANLRDVIARERESSELWKYDIVLALGIIHKLHDPSVPMAFAADSCADLLCFRAPAAKGNLPKGEYVIKSKFTTNECNVPRLMRERGFVDEGTFPGVRGESVQYWRRKR